MRILLPKRSFLLVIFRIIPDGWDRIRINYFDRSITAEIWADTGCDNELLFKAVVGQLRGDAYSLLKSIFSSGQSTGHRNYGRIFLNSNLEISTYYKTFEQKF